MNLQVSISQRRSFLIGCCVLFVGVSGLGGQEVQRDDDASHLELFRKENLVAWCIVPFDKNKRGPVERAEMLKDLGIKKVAYDWRAEHVPTFEEEIQECDKKGIEFFAFWSWHDSLESLVKKYKIQPQIWVTVPSPNQSGQTERVGQAVDSLLPLVEKTKSLGLKLGLYNHGGWGGQPTNLIQVCEALRERSETDHVGIVYNFHHAHQDIQEFYTSLPKMAPYLLCVNLNGMVNWEEVVEKNKKIIPIGSGSYEREMMGRVIKSGYRGPIGILDHRSELDARESLQQNLSGLNDLIERW